eukprot:12350-Amphidinium_carterae.1
MLTFQSPPICTGFGDTLGCPTLLGVALDCSSLIPFRQARSRTNILVQRAYNSQTRLQKFFEQSNFPCRQSKLLMASAMQAEGTKPSPDEFQERLNDSSFMSSLQTGVNKWAKACCHLASRTETVTDSLH